MGPSVGEVAGSRDGELGCRPSWSLLPLDSIGLLPQPMGQFEQGTIGNRTAKRVAVGAKLGLRGAVEQVDPMPEQRQPLAVREVRHGDAEQATERTGRLRQQHFRALDEVVHCGGSACVRLARDLQASIAGVGVVVELEFLAGRSRLNGVEVFSLLKYRE